MPKVVHTEPKDYSEINLYKEMNKNTDIISSLIHEYLLKREYYKSLDSFQDDLARKLKQKNYYKTTFLDITNTNVIKTLSLGNKEDFFKQWNRIIPNHIKLREGQVEKTEFYIQVYFAIYPLLYKNSFTNNNTTLKQSMAEFKQYLEQKQNDLSKHNEFLEYYALPYIPNPQTHPSYSKLFQPEWTNELKEKIKNCIKSYLPNVKYPAIYELVCNDNAYASGNLNVSNISQTKFQMMKTFLEGLAEHVDVQESGNINNNAINSNSGEDTLFASSQVNDEIIKLREDYMRLKQKDERNKNAFLDFQRSWTNLALNILSYSFDLVMLCKSKKNINDVFLQTDKINKKLLKYQAFLNKNLEQLDKGNKTFNNAAVEQNDILMDTIANSRYDDISGINNSYNAGNQSFKNEINQSHLLDMISLTNSLKNINDKTPPEDDIKLSYIIREIRLRIFRRNDMKMKNLTLYSVFYYDLVFKYNIAHNILTNSSQCPMLALELMKLLNQISALTKGRNYLLMNKSGLTLVEDIVRCMMNEKGDTELRQNCLGTIQKFTLRFEPQNKIISLDIIKWLVDTFTYEGASLSDYTIEYGMALIMNLALRKKGRDKFELEAERVIQVLINYINKENNQIKTCVNGTLYSLLKRKRFVDEAKKFNLGDLLLNTKENDPQLKKQIGYIVEEMNNYNESDVQEEDENIEEDPTAIDNDNNTLLDEEYSDLDSIDEESLKNHYKFLDVFVIRNDEVNSEEEQKLEIFSKNNPSMIREEINNDKSVEEIKNDSNEQQNKPKEENKEENKGNSGEGNYDKDMDIAKAFEKKDRIARTPPGEVK